MNAVPPDELPILYFDGMCGFCNGTVNFLLDRDRQGKLRYAPLQGETAKQRLPPEYTKNLNSIVLAVDGRNYQKTSATIRILWLLGGVWSVLGTALWLIPKPIRDLGYSVVARNRYRFAGRLEACRMPRPGEETRFLP